MGLCLCGCGRETVKNDSRYIHGHHMRGIKRRPLSQESINKLKATLALPEVKKRKSESRKGKGTGPHSQEWVEKVKRAKSLPHVKNRDIERAHEQWNNPEYVSKQMAKRRNPEYKKRQAETAKKYWKNEDL